MDGTSGIIFGSLVSAILCCSAALAWFTIEDRHFHCIPANGYDVLYQSHLPLKAVRSDMKAKRIRGFKPIMGSVELDGSWTVFYEKGR